MYEAHNISAERLKGKILQKNAYPKRMHYLCMTLKRAMKEVLGHLKKKTLFYTYKNHLFLLISTINGVL